MRFKMLNATLATARVTILATVFATVLAALPMSSSAAGYPAHTIKIIVPFTAGGTSDLLARTVGQQMSKDWGQSVVIENRPGAGATIGTAMVAHSNPDGYTLLMGSSSALAVNPYLLKSLQYDANKDFVPISFVAGIQNILLVNPSLPIKSVSDLIAYAKQHRLLFASAGIGSSPHMSAEAFEQMSGVQMTHVAFKGAPEALTEVMAGRVNLDFDNLPTAMPLAKSGQLRAIAVTGAHRSPLMPDTPTIAESGLPGYDVTVWYGLLAPTGTPADVVAKLNAEVRHILSMPDIIKQLSALGTEPKGTSSEAFGKFILSEQAKWKQTIEKAGIKPQ